MTADQTPPNDPQAPDTLRAYIERMIQCAPFADQTAGIPEMVTALRALLAERRDIDAALTAAAAQAMREAAVKVAQDKHDSAAKWAAHYLKEFDGQTDSLLIAQEIRALPDTAALDRMIAEARREAVEEVALHLTSIFYPEERAGYEAAEEMTRAHEDIQARAVRSYPGANGDVVTALSMAVRQHESVISEAKARYERIRQAIAALAKGQQP